ncbi:MAG: CPBP family intramembrane glutamic endopeptidase [Bacteroidota bacterium]
MKDLIYEFLPSETSKTHPKKFLGLSVLLLLGINFIMSYFAHTYYSQDLLKISSPGFWLFIFTFVLITGIVLWNKRLMGWSWSDLGLGKPKNWWKPILIAAAVYAAFTLFVMYVVPHIQALGERQDHTHLLALRGNLPLLIFALIMVWITAAFLEEVIFRAYLINTLDMLFGKNLWSAWAAVVISAVLFGLLHSYQGLTGILMTGSIGFIFGVFYLLNGRRIWPLILVHGLIDTVALVSIYNM